MIISQTGYSSAHGCQVYLPQTKLLKSLRHISTHINETIISDSRSWDCCQAIWQVLVVFSSVSFVMIRSSTLPFLLWWCLYGRVSSNCQSLSLSKSCLKHTGNLTNNRYSYSYYNYFLHWRPVWGKYSLCLLAIWSSYCDIMFG